MHPLALPALAYPDSLIREILTSCRRIAMVGASDNPARPSYFVFKYLISRGYQVIPVNPSRVGKQLHGVPFVASLADIETAVDMIDIFRSSDAAMSILDEALALPVLPRIIWMQLGVRNDEAAAKAEAAGMTVIMDRCPKIEFGRLSGEVGWQGINSRVLSSKRPVLAKGGIQKRGL